MLVVVVVSFGVGCGCVGGSVAIGGIEECWLW